MTGNPTADVATPAVTDADVAVDCNNKGRILCHDTAANDGNQDQRQTA
jgi:hypothetical protein